MRLPKSRLPQTAGLAQWPRPVTGTACTSCSPLTVAGTAAELRAEARAPRSRYRREWRPADGAPRLFSWNVSMCNPPLRGSDLIAAFSPLTRKAKSPSAHHACTPLRRANEPVTEAPALAIRSIPASQAPRNVPIHRVTVRCSSMPKAEARLGAGVTINRAACDASRTPDSFEGGLAAVRR